MIQPTESFKENLQLLPSIDGLARLDLLNDAQDIVASVENKPGKQGSLAVYQYLIQSFEKIDSKAAQHGLAVFAEHTADAQNRPGAHPNIDLLLDIVNGAPALTAKLISQS